MGEKPIGEGDGSIDQSFEKRWVTCLVFFKESKTWVDFFEAQLGLLSKKAGRGIEQGDDNQAIKSSCLCNLILLIFYFYKNTKSNESPYTKR